MRKKDDHSTGNPSLIAFKQKVADLIDKSRRLKRDITKALDEGETESASFSPRPDTRGPHASMSSVSEALLSHWDNCGGDCDFVDLVSGENFVSSKWNALDAFPSSVPSSEDELSENDDPLRNESLVQSLFYGDLCRSTGGGGETSDKKERHVKEVQEKRVNFVGKLEGKSLPMNKRSPPRKASRVSLKKGSKAKKVEGGGQKEVGETMVPTKDFVADTVEPLSVFCLLSVKRGSGFASNMVGWIHARSESVNGRNLYLNCRMFWNSDTVKSDVCWNSNDPSFCFQQIAPVLVTDSLLQRVQNNIMVIEVWEKRIPPKTELLVGICKVPLHLFYLSFRDREVAKSLLRSQNAVIATNDMLPVVDLFCGRNVGRLGVFLALGTREQVETLRRSSDLDVISRCVFRTIEDHVSGDLSVTHVFNVTVDSLTLGVPPGSTIWAESDCYVQYLFLNQIPVDDLCLGSVYLSVHRLNRVLCEPIMHWKSTTKHVITQSSSVPIHRTLLGVCPRNGLPFQVWCKYYYPIEKEELVAEVLVPVAKLCSLIKDGVVKLSLPLVANDPNLNLEVGNPLRNKYANLGTLNVELGYHTRGDGDVHTLEPRRQPETEQRCSLVAKPSISPPPEKVDNPCEPERDVQTFPTSISIERAVNLPVVNENERDKMPNAYVFFSDKYETHFTDVVPNSDEPRWNWQKKVDLPVLPSNRLIEFKVCHAENSDDGIVARNLGDLVLGCASIDLSPLLLGFSQVCGWYNVVNDRSCCCGQIKIVVQPLCNLPMFWCLPRHSDANVHSLSTDCHLTAGSYAEFPSHISQFAQQKMQFKNDPPSTQILSDSSLDDKSRSFLMTNLKERLSELDNLFCRTSVVDETSTLILVPSIDCSSADGQQSTPDVVDKRIELVNPLIVNVRSDMQQTATLNDKVGPAKEETLHFVVQNETNEVAEVLPKRKMRSRIAAAIFNTHKQF